MTVIYDPPGLPPDWPEVAAVVLVNREREVGGERTCTSHYYLTSYAGTAAEIAGFVRGHWGIEIPQSEDPRSDNLCVAGRAGYHRRGGPAGVGRVERPATSGPRRQLMLINESNLRPPPPTAPPPDPLTAIWAQLPPDRRRRLQRLLAELLARPVDHRQRPRRGRGVMTTTPRDPPSSPKLKPWHLDRAAIVYVRQSTPQQVLDHQESTARQYALADRAVALGWPRSQVQVIDDDLGKSGQSIEGRPGFQRLLAEVALDRVGLILGLEMSRLARSCKDWHHLLELCARFRVLLADADIGLRPDRILGSPAARADRHDERSRTAYPQAKDVPGEVEQGPPRGVGGRRPGRVRQVAGRGGHLRPGRAGPGGHPPGLRPVRSAGDGARRPAVI